MGLMLKFSANIGFLWTDRSHVERIQAASAAGFDAVECHFPYDEPAKEVKAALEETGLPMLCVNTWPGDRDAGDFGLAAVPGREADARDAIDQAIAYAEAIDAANVHVMAGKPGDGRQKEAHETYLENLSYACSIASPHGIDILIEPINGTDAPGYFLQYAGFAKEIIGQVGSPNLKIMFDCYHTQLMQGSLSRWIEYLMPLIGHIQIAAVPSRAEPDEGEVAYDWLLPAISAMGYRGYVGAEYKPRGKVEDGLGWLEDFRAKMR